ncbi:MAG: amino acid-binding protein [Bacteroidales bacterium]|nr:amino acid-binding protein [Bacteroidales bacterium]
MKQLSVFLENTAGTITQVLQVLKASNTQLYAISIADTAEYGICRLICEDAEKAFETLREAGFVASLTNVFAVKMDNKPGAAADIVALFASSGVDIAYLYSAIIGGTPFLIFRTGDSLRAVDIISANGLTVAEF